jgi:hypothetical protein
VHAALGAASEIPDEPAFNGAAQRLALSGCTFKSWNVVEEPAQLRTREIGGKGKAGLRPKTIWSSLTGQLLAERISTRVLPDNGRGVGLASFSIPDDKSFALVRNANGSDFLAFDAGLSQRFMEDSLCVLPNFHGVVFYPTRLRVVLRMFLLGQTNKLRGAIENQAAGACGALVDRKDVASPHGCV